MSLLSSKRRSATISRFFVSPRRILAEDNSIRDLFFADTASFVNLGQQTSLRVHSQSKARLRQSHKIKYNSPSCLLQGRDHLFNRLRLRHTAGIVEDIVVVGLNTFKERCYNPVEGCRKNNIPQSFPFLLYFSFLASYVMKNSHFSQHSRQHASRVILQRAHGFLQRFGRGSLRIITSWLCTPLLYYTTFPPKKSRQT